VAPTAQDVAAFLRVSHAEVEVVRVVLEELAAKRELGTLKSAPHVAGQPFDWRTSYFPMRSA
jgi:hypothetical protein